MNNHEGQGDSPSDFDQPPSQLHLQNKGYQLLHQLIIFVLLALLLLYSLPLSILHYRSCLSSTPCSNDLLLQLSIFSSINSLTTLNLAWYLTLPAALTIFLLQSLWYRKLNNIRHKHYQTGRYPDSHACLLTLGSSNIAETHLEAQIQHWWEQQLNKYKQQIVKLSPEAGKEQNFEMSSVCSGPVIKTSMRSKLVHQIISSYNYQRLKQARATPHIGGGSGLEWLGTIGRSQRNRVLQSAKNRFCIVIFKSSFLAQYFYLAHNPSVAHKICSDRYQPMLVQKKPVTVQRDFLPNDLFWEHMHLLGFDIFLSQLPGWLILGAIVAAASGAWYGVTQLQNSVSESGQKVKSLYVAVIGLIANIVAWVARKVIVKLRDKEMAYLYADKQSWILLKIVLSDAFIIVLLPSVIYWGVNKQLLWGNLSLPQILTSSVGFHSAFTIISKIYSLANIQQLFDCEKKSTQPILDQLQRMGYMLTSLSITLLALTTEPLVVGITFACLVLDLLLDQASLGKCYRYGSNHGLNLCDKAVSSVKMTSLLLAISVSFSGGMVAMADTSCQGAIISGCLLMLILLVQAVLPAGLFFGFETVEVQDTYIQKKDKCVQLHEDTNEPYLLALGQKESTATKIEEEMNTLSKTLSLSLKEQLMSRQTPVLGNFNRLQEKQEDQIDSLYFQYEQKVFMAAACPKVAIPPLFERQATQEEAFEEPVYLGQCSWLDKQAKKRVKKQVRDQFNVGGTNSLHYPMIPQNRSE